MRIDDLNAAEVVGRLNSILILVGTDGSLLDASPAALDCYGYSLQEFRLLGITDLRVDDDPHVIEAQLRQAAVEGASFHAVHHRKDGSCFPVEVRSASITAGGETALLSVIRDISESERISAEASLLAQAETVARIGSWRMDIVTHHIEWSDQLYVLFGLDRDTYQGDLTTVVRDSVHPEDRARFDASARAAERGEILAVGNYRIVRPDGTIRWVRGGAGKVRDSQGTVTALQGYVQDVTEIQEAATALVARDHMTRALLDAITESAFLMTPEGELIELNATTALRLGAEDPADLRGKNAYDLLEPDVAARRRAFVEQLVATGTPVTFEDVRDGRRVLNSLYPVVSGDAVTHIAGVGYDVTEMSEAAESLRRSEEWLRESQRLAHLGHYVFDIAQDRWESSASLDEIFGIEADYQRDLAGWLALVHPDEREPIAEYFEQEVVGKRAPFEAEYRIVRPSDGVERWVLGLGHVDYAEDGQPLQMFGVIQDITERKLAERELRLEQQMLSQVEAVAHVGSFRVSLVGGSHTWSAEAGRIIGIEPHASDDGQLTGFTRAVHAEDRWVLDRTRLQELWSDGDRAVDFRVVRSDGEVRWVSARGSLEMDSSGMPVAVSGVIQDVSDRKHAEDERVGRLEEAANIDRLTGLNNRRGFDHMVERALSQAERSGQSVGLIYCDVDDLKSINDEFGHAQGDRALQDAASILRFTLRSADAVARVGGDEFIVLTIGGDEDAIDRLNARLQEGLDFFNATNDRPYQLSMSSGTAWCSQEDVCRLDSLQAEADAAMYAEKLRRREL